MILFLISLSQDCFYVDWQGTRVANSLGWFLFMFGIFAVFDGFFAWFANLFLIRAWMQIWFSEGRGISLLNSLLAILLALTFLFHSSHRWNSVGDRAKIIGYGVGYWLWTGSIAVMLLGNVLLFYLQQVGADIHATSSQDETE